MMRRDDQGFTLVETLVSFVILSSTILMALKALNDGLLALRRVGEASRRAEIIAAELDKHLLAGDLAHGPISGETGGVAWSISARPLADEAPGRNPLRPWLVTASGADGATIASTIVLLRAEQ
ncbi:MAG: type II secretion system protein [Alphaproteobacteria bacterium]|nr:type II secretion system protein [Alphaproteobacteria bacterium]